MGKPKPYLQVACVCENVLIEPDQVPSLIRVVGKFIVTPPSMEGIPKDIPTGFPMKFFIMLKAGEAAGQGKGTVTVAGTRPDGSEAPVVGSEVEFPSGPTSTINIKGEFHIVSPQNGTYWFAILWNGELLTKIPVEVETTKPAQVQEGASLTARPATPT